MNLFKRKPSGQKGQSVVELSLLLPILLMIALGAVEYTNMFMVSLRVSNLSRTASNTGFRDCAFLTSNTMSTCLNSNTNRVADEGTMILEDFAARGTVITTTYEYSSGAAPNVTLLGQAVGSGGAHASRYTPSNVDADIVQGQDRIVIGEVSYNYVPITPLSGFLAFFNISPVIYEVTIY